MCRRLHNKNVRGQEKKDLILQQSESNKNLLVNFKHIP